MLVLGVPGVLAWVLGEGVGFVVVALLPVAAFSHNPPQRPASSKLFQLAIFCQTFFKFGCCILVFSKLDNLLSLLSPPPNVPRPPFPTDREPPPGTYFLNNEIPIFLVKKFFSIAILNFSTFVPHNCS